MMELLNVESVKSGKITAGKACRGVSSIHSAIATTEYQGFAPTPQKCSALRNTFSRKDI